METEFVMSEFGLLELVRALTKHGFEKSDIDEAYNSVLELFNTKAISGVPLEDTVNLAKDIEISLNLFAGDALHLASAASHGCKIFWSADKHHLKESTRIYMRRVNIEIRSLNDSC